MTKEANKPERGSKGFIGPLTWEALGKPDGWLVDHGGSWVYAEDLKEMDEDD